jgi:hypothetical protein
MEEGRFDIKMDQLKVKFCSKGKNNKEALFSDSQCIGFKKVNARDFSISFATT